MPRFGLILFFLSIPLSMAHSQVNTSNHQNAVSVDSSVDYYFLPDQDDLIIPIIGLSWEGFYFEGRYNYESRDTGSMWLGIPFSFGHQLEVEITPMIGGIIGAIDGMAPGFELDATWKDFNLYSEAEYVFDFASREGNFLYASSELTYALLEKLKFGIAGSRTRAYSSDVDINRGPLLAYEAENFSLSVVALNIDTKPITTISAALSF